MESKIIFLDLDGTLVHPNAKISEKNKEAILRAKQNGHLVYICTGRNLCSIDNELKEIGFDGIISSAGGYIEINNEVIYTSYIEEETLVKIREVFDRNTVYYTLEASECSYATEELTKLFVLGKNVKEMNSEMQRLCNEANKAFNMRPLEVYQQEKNGIHKVSFVAKTKEQLEEPKRILEKDFSFVVHDIFSRDTINGEIIDRSTNKATGIYKVLSLLNRNIKDTIGFGDSMNDYEMIEAVEIGIAMKNAPAQLKQVASAICKDVTEDAIYHEFKRLQLI